MPDAVLNALPTFSKFQCYNLPGRIEFSHFQRRQLRQADCVASRVCGLCPRLRRGKGLEMISETWFFCPLQAFSHGIEWGGVSSLPKRMPEGARIQPRRRNSNGSSFCFLDH